MSRVSIARNAALAVIAAVGIAGISSPLVAQRTTPRPALGPPPAPSAPRTPYPGATVIVDPLVHASPRGVHPGRGHQSQGGYGQAPFYYPTAGYGVGGGGVYDTNGRPLWSGYDAQPAASMMSSGEYGGSTPDLSGSPYTVIDGGTMVVDFGNGDRRAVPSCASVEKASTPDGQPRTIFYRPPAYALVLRAGQHGQVLGRPTAGARVCYTMDAYGRVVLAY